MTHLAPFGGVGANEVEDLEHVLGLIGGTGGGQHFSLLESFDPRSDSSFCCGPSQPPCQASPGGAGFVFWDGPAWDASGPDSIIRRALPSSAVLIDGPIKGKWRASWGVAGDLEVKLGLS